MCCYFCERSAPKRCCFPSLSLPLLCFVVLVLFGSPSSVAASFDGVEKRSDAAPTQVTVLYGYVNDPKLLDHELLSTSKLNDSPVLVTIRVNAQIPDDDDSVSTPALYSFLRRPHARWGLREGEFSSCGGFWVPEWSRHADGNLLLAQRNGRAASSWDTLLHHLSNRAVCDNPTMSFCGTAEVGDSPQELFDLTEKWWRAFLGMETLEIPNSEKGGFARPGQVPHLWQPVRWVVSPTTPTNSSSNWCGYTELSVLPLCLEVMAKLLGRGVSEQRIEMNHSDGVKQWYRIPSIPSSQPVVFPSLGNVLDAFHYLMVPLRQQVMEGFYDLYVRSSVPVSGGGLAVEIQLSVLFSHPSSVDSVAAQLRTGLQRLKAQEGEGCEIHTEMGDLGAPSSLRDVLDGMKRAQHRDALPESPPPNTTRRSYGLNGHISSLMEGKRADYGVYLTVHGVESADDDSQDGMTVLTTITFPLAVVHPFLHAVRATERVFSRVAFIETEVVSSLLDEKRGFLHVTFLSRVPAGRMRSGKLLLFRVPLQEVWGGLVLLPPFKTSSYPLPTPVAVLMPSAAPPLTTDGDSTSLRRWLCDALMQGEELSGVDMRHSRALSAMLAAQWECDLQRGGEATSPRPERVVWVRGTEVSSVVLRTHDEDLAIPSLIGYIFIQWVMLPIALVRLAFKLYL